MKPKIDRFCDRYIAENYKKSDQQKNDDVKFEWFVNSMHCWENSNKSYKSISFIGKEISLGTSEGIDSFFVVIDKTIYPISADIIDVLEKLKDNDNVNIQFHFIQTKNSSGATIGSFQQFTNIVLSLINNSSLEGFNAKLLQVKDFINQITEFQFRNVSYTFNLFFYCKKNSQDLEALNNDWATYINNSKAQLNEFVNETKIELRGIDYLCNLYEKFTSNEIEILITKDNIKSLSQDDEIECFVGYLTAQELLDGIAPITNNKRVLLPDAFKHNIRLYLGVTDINKSIENTLIKEPQKFHLYNNGITIITKEVNRSNMEKQRICPVNIVNGCQTANSIFNVLTDNPKIKEDSVRIPVKIISIKTDDSISRNVTIRSNSQNGVSEKELVSISDIQVEIEEKFKHFKPRNNTFCYIRQTVGTRTEPISDYVVNISDILRAVFSTFLQGSHLVSAKFDITTKQFIHTIFKDELIDLYLISTALYLYVENYFEENETYFSNRMKYIVTYLLYLLCCKNIDEFDARFLSSFFRSKYNKQEQIEKLNSFKKDIYSNIYGVINNENSFKKCITYVLDVLKSKYSEFLYLTGKKEERVLYLSPVNKFQNFSINFNKNINDIINNATN